MAESTKAPIRAHAPRRLDVPLLAGIALAMLCGGVTVPALEFEYLFGGESFSVLSGIWGFATSGNLLLAVLLFAFSVLFPVAKLVAILGLWFVPTRRATRRELVEWLEMLGKWSLLDAFVITVIIGAVQLGILAEAAAQPGVYLYLAAIVLSLVATALLRNVAGIDGEERARRLHLPGLLITIPAASLFAAGLSTPLIEVEKGWFWSNEYSLLDGIGELFARGDWGLATALLGFVVVVPGVRFLALIVLRALRTKDARLTSPLRMLDRWSMVEVFVLALLVVFTKLSSLATPTPRLGMWLLMGSAALTFVDSIVLHRGWRRQQST